MTRLTALVLLLLALPARAAPVPPPPRLADAVLVGTWDQEWGEAFRGPVTFWADGTYRFDDAGGVLAYVGRWWIDRDALVLMEHAVRVRTGEVAHTPTRYEIRLTTAHYPRITGTVRGSNAKLVLTAPKP